MHPLKNTERTKNTERIGAIDALRAFALLGILLVHTVENFGFFEESLSTGPVDRFLSMVISNIFHNRSNAIFSLLFGCSFWFLLRNPRYPSIKFAWRCILLAAIGVVAKLFYTYDILLWYGLCGVLLIAFRRCPARVLAAVAVGLLLLSPVLSYFHPARLLHSTPFEPRYITGHTLGEITDYPLSEAVKESLLAALDNLSLRTLGLMVLGYWAGCKGYILRWREIITGRLTLVATIATGVLFAISHVVRGDGSSLLFLISSDWLFTAQALFMTILFLWLCRKGGRWVEPLACYGRLGLTNYFFQSVIGVTLTCVWLLPSGYTLTMQCVIMTAFFLLQMAFSIFWCRTHRYGPLEYLWRKATSLIPNRK